MIISIGVLAWNEETSIGVTLQSLFDQSLFQELATRPDLHIELIVVPNGCSDHTADRAADILRAGAMAWDTARFSWRVENIAEAGKVNAWNRYVHDFSDPASEYVFLVDADIQFTHPDTLKNMVQTLIDHPHAEVSTDLPQKHLLFKARKTVRDHLSLAIARVTQTAPAQLTGQLYCARGALLRRIYMPIGLIVEDGFLKQMVCTHLFTQRSDPSRVIRAPHASHVFEAYFRIADVFNNQRRQQIGHCVYTYLRDFIQAASGRDAGLLIAENNRRDPDWFRKVIRQRVEQSGWWVMYPGAFSVRFRRLRALPFRQAILQLPVASAAFLLDAVVLIAANQRLRSGQLAGVWKDTKTVTLGEPPTSKV